MREKIIEKTLTGRIIAIVRGVYGEAGLLLSDALHAGGVDMIEFTFDQARPETFEATQSIISAVNERFGGGVLAGAGTVTSLRLVDMAHEAGAGYIISPNRDVRVIERTRKLGMVSMPGALTPSEALEAHEAGADFIKLFPVSVLGAKYVKAISAPLNHLRFLAVGGVDASNVAEFLRAGCLGAGVGGRLVSKDSIQSGSYESITESARELMAAARSVD